MLVLSVSINLKTPDHGYDFECILAGSSATNKSGYCESASAGLSLVRGEYACLALYSGITQHLMHQSFGFIIIL